MLIARVGVRRAVLGAGVAGWAALVVLTIVDVVHPELASAINGRYALMVFAGSVAMAATVSGVVMSTVCAMYKAWREGVDYGRRQEARERRSDAPLRLVRQ